MITDATLLRIGEAVQLHHGAGRREQARQVFAQIWEEIGADRGDPLHVCVLAHAMADVQDDVREELLWDQRALAAADRLTEARVAGAGVPLPVAGLYPSLHLNLGECYRRLGDLDRAREHLEQARAGIGTLGDDEYGRLIKDGLDRLARLLAGPVTGAGKSRAAWTGSPGCWPPRDRSGKPDEAGGRGRNTHGRADLLPELAQRMREPQAIAGAARLTETDPSMLGAGPHVIGVATKEGSGR